MKMMTLKVSPKMIFGIILVITGIVVVTITFLSNHNVGDSKSAAAQPSCATDEKRRELLNSKGWELGKSTSKELTIPSQWEKVYKDYNKVQQSSGFDLTKYKGKNVTLYTYEITNFGDDEKGIVADLLVSDGELIGGDICNTSASDGFLVGLQNKNDFTTG